MGTVNICVFGDSIAYGAWDDRGGWVDRLRAYLHAETLRSCFQSYYFLYHLGIPGNTTADVLLRLPSEAKGREPHVIIFAIGINDSRWRKPDHVPHVEESLFRKNISELIRTARRFAPHIVFIGLTPVDESKTMPFDPGCYFENERIGRYNSMIREIAADENVFFLEVSGALAPASDLADGLHPNRAGHEKLFILIRDFLTNKHLI